MLTLPSCVSSVTGEGTLKCVCIDTHIHTNTHLSRVFIFYLKLLLFYYYFNNIIINGII